MGFDFRRLPRCGAKTRVTAGSTCQQPAMPNGRCYLHGGKSTGPRTEEGMKRMRASKIKHGRYCKERIFEKRVFRKKIKAIEDELKSLLEP